MAFLHIFTLAVVFQKAQFSDLKHRLCVQKALFKKYVCRIVIHWLLLFDIFYIIPVISSSMSYLLYHMSYIFYLLPRFYISLRDFLDLIELYWRFSVWVWRGGGGGGSVHVFMYMCHRAAGAVWIAESCGQVSDGGGRRSRTSSSSSKGGNGCGRTGEERTARDEEARWHGRLPPPPKKNVKNEDQRFAAAEGRNTRTRRLKRLTTAIPVLIHPLNQMARTGFSRSYVIILERKQVHLPIKVVIKHKIKWEHLKELKVKLTENIMRKLNMRKRLFIHSLHHKTDLMLN